MVISVDDRLVDVQNYFAEKGYSVHKLSERIISDVYIYSNGDEGLSHITNSVVGNENGSFLIDADGKSFRELEYMINKRTYSPLLLD